jgi:hypothetical protein
MRWISKRENNPVLTQSQRKGNLAPVGNDPLGTILE